MVNISESRFNEAKRKLEMFEKDIDVTNLFIAKNKQLEEKKIAKGKKIDKSKDVKMDGNIFRFEGQIFAITMEKGETIWINGIDVTKFLGYPTKKTSEYINDKVSEENIKNHGDIIDPQILIRRKSTGKNTKYINKEGFVEYLMSANRNKDVKKFKKWIAGLLVKIDEGVEIYAQTNINRFKITQDDNKYKDWAENDVLLSVKDKPTIYLASVGKITDIEDGVDTNIKEGEYIFKFGITYDEERRLSEHKNNIDDYICFFITPCYRNAELEKSLKSELKRKSLLRNIEFKNKKYTELFVTSDKFTIDDIEEYIAKWIEEKDLKLMSSDCKQKELDIRQTELNIEQLKLTIEQTKLNIEQKKLEIRGKELDIELYNLKSNT